MIVTANPEIVVDAIKRPEFKTLLNSSSLIVPDGIGVLWAAYYTSLPPTKNSFVKGWRIFSSLFKVLIKSKDIFKSLPQRVTGSDLLFKIVKQSQENHWRIYLLGAAPGVADMAISKLEKKYPGCIFAGSFPGTPAVTHEDELCERINASEPDILFVAYGSPAQEEWIHRNLGKLNTVKVALGIGGAIDFAAGKAKRAPKFIQNIGLEWLWRLFRQPKRIKRIWTATVVFVKKIVNYN